MLVVLLLLSIGGIVAGSGANALGRARQFDDVARFHRARGITTGWARAHGRSRQG